MERANIELGVNGMPGRAVTQFEAPSATRGRGERRAGGADVSATYFLRPPALLLPELPGLPVATSLALLLTL